jgi:hypothetical protein
MLLGGAARDHGHDNVATFSKGYVLIRKVVVRLDECVGYYLPWAPAEHKTKETISCVVKVASKRQPFIQVRCGGSEGYWILLHSVFLSLTSAMMLGVPTHFEGEDDVESAALSESSSWVALLRNTLLTEQSSLHTLNTNTSIANEARPRFGFLLKRYANAIIPKYASSSK